MTLNQATEVLDRYAAKSLPLNDVSLATVAHALYTVHQAAQKGGAH